LCEVKVVGYGVGRARYCVGVRSVVKSLDKLVSHLL
jgi:hypothetical protein